MFFYSALFSLAVGALAAPSKGLVARNDSCNAFAMRRLIIGGGPSGTVAVANFNGTGFDVVANDTRPGTSASWLLFKEPNLLYAVDENSNTTRLFNMNFTTNDLTLVQNATGSSGVVSLEFNAAKDRMVGAAYGEGQIDVWDVSATNGSMTLLKQIPSVGELGPNKDRQDQPHPHQALLDPSGRFFVVNDLGTDSVMVIDSAEDAFEVVNTVRVPTPGCGPRHGAFFPVPAYGEQANATHYMVVCEMLSMLQVFSVAYGEEGNMTFTPTQNMSTYGAAFPPANVTTAAAGEITISNDNANVYVSNRLSGNETDSIAHFAINKTESGDITIAFVDTVSSGGKVPRMFSLSEDDNETMLFSTNQDGASGLLAFARSTNGTLGADPMGTVDLATFGASGFGPQFVQEIVLESE